MTINQHSCAFTGHRPHKFPWKYDETDSRCVELKTVLTEQIAMLVSTGVTGYFTGGADGVDCWAAEIVLSLREKNPTLNLHCILPYEGQADRWSDSARERYYSILKRADSVDYVSRQYYDGCLLDRNRRLVESAGLLLAVFNGVRRSGTGNKEISHQHCGKGYSRRSRRACGCELYAPPLPRFTEDGRLLHRRTLGLEPSQTGGVP